MASKQNGKMLNISHQGSTNQNHNEMSIQTYWDGQHPKVRELQVGKDVEQLEPLDTACRNRLVQPFWKIAWQFLKEFNIELPFDTAISLLGIYSREIKTCLPKSLYTNVHSIIIQKSQMVGIIQSPSIAEWISQIQYTLIME